MLSDTQDQSFFTKEEIQKFKDLAKLHFGRDLADEEAFDQFHRLFLQVEDIVLPARNGTMNI